MTVSLRKVRLDRMHPRQAAALAGIPLYHVPFIVDRAHLQQNLGGGILSGWIHSAVRDYKRLNGDVDKMRHQDRANNIAAMRSCCADCRRQAERMEAR
jgi:hypothetical protein